MLQTIRPPLLCALCAFLLSALLERLLIPLLRAMKAGQSIREIGPTWHKDKEGTPTMGGIAFILAAAVSMLLCSWREMREGSFEHLYVLGFALVYGAIGFADDYVKVKQHRNLGLTAKQKLALQLAAAFAYLLLLRWSGHLTSSLYIPFANITVDIPWWLYLVFAVFVTVGCVNAVNLTDGVDGLAASVTIPVMAFFTIVASIWSLFPETGIRTLGLFPAALVGALGGFLIYNFHPAKVFMGDTGSLFLGAAVCGLAFALDMPLVLLLVGIIYIIETVSVILQVSYFKLTHGRRIFKMTPIHHHFEICGWSEVKIVAVFALITALCCAAAFVGVAGRY